MKNKNGFTLVELLAVIAILAILVIIAVPNVIKMFTASKKKIFVTDTQTILKNVESYVVAEGLKNPTDPINLDFSNVGCEDSIELANFSVTINYFVEVNGGKVTHAEFSNKEFYTDLTGTDVKIQESNVEAVEQRTDMNSNVICNP